MIIDYSAWRAWKNCSGEWFEKYVNKRQPKWPQRQRDDALCLGSLVHEGLRIWQETGTVGIPPEVVEANTPTKETYDTALELVYGYTQAYPKEEWPLILCEQPLTWPLNPKRRDPSCCEDCYKEAWELTGLAKLDAFFYVPTPTTIPSGQPGLEFTLSEGWWGHEYKTKSPDISLGLFITKWGMNMQASFQTLALQEEINRSYKDVYPSSQVQGILVNVLEKPKRYVPKRKCKECQDTYEFNTWLPTGDGRYSCPVCGNRQELQGLKENPVTRPPQYYRIIVTRTQEQLTKATQDIIQVGERMIQMEQGGLLSEEWNTEACVQWKKPCPFYNNHLYGGSTKDDPGMQDVEDYRGLVEIEV